MRANSPVVLIVDDEEQIGMLASVCLQKLRYVTLLSNCTTMAMDHWTRSHSEIDMILTDLAMPDGRGDHLAEKLLREKPSLRVIFMSGSPFRTGEIAFPLDEGVNCLHKPFSRDALTKLFINNPASRDHTHH
jgi:two-component system, cell cycle sensor histidine kinase and response regulator CckA